jgi:hypothetical protein
VPRNNSESKRKLRFCLGPKDDRSRFSSLVERDDDGDLPQVRLLFHQGFEPAKFAGDQIEHGPETGGYTQRGAGGGGIAAAAAVNKWLIFSVRTHARRITHENRRRRGK